MTERPAPTRTPLWIGLFIAAPTAAFLDVAFSVLDRPKAFADGGALLLPMALTLALFLMGWLAVWFAFAPVRRILRLDAFATACALSATTVLAGVLTPLVEVLGRGVVPQREPALWALTVSVFVVTALLGYLVAARPPRWWGGWSELAVRLAPFAAAGLLAGVWMAEYRGGSTLMVLGAFVLCTGFAVPLANRVSAAPAFVALMLLSPLAAPLVTRDSGAGSTSEARQAPASNTARPERVVLITVDTLRSDYVGQLNPAAPPATPSIDALLQDSVVFSGARSAAPWTKPSLASLLTGLAPEVHRTNNRRARLPESATTLAEYMQTVGYRTVGMGLNVHLENVFRFGQGFEEYYFPARGDYGISLGAKLLQQLDPHRYPALFPSTIAITDVAIEWVRENRDEPFFLWIHLLDPHWPYEPPPRYVDAEPPYPGAGFFWGDPGTVTNVQAGNHKLGGADREWVRELYEGEIRYADENVGRLLDTLRELDLYDDTLIAFASDHGEEFWEHGRFEHGHTMYDEVMRVPLAFKLPGATSTERIATPVSTQALTPTLVELVGAEAPDGLFLNDSLRPFWTGAAPERPDPLFATATYYHGEKLMVLFDYGGPYKLVHELDTDQKLLFDLTADPDEQSSLAGDPMNDDIRAIGEDLLKEYVRHSSELRGVLAIEDDAGYMDEATSDLLDRLGYGGGDGAEH